MSSLRVMRASAGCTMLVLAGFVAGCPGMSPTTPVSDPCEGVTCGAGESCVDGTCVADQPADPCAGVTCSAGESCVGGTCVADQPAGVSFSADIQPIFDTNCIVCHVPGGFAEFTGLFLTSGNSFNLLVNQSSTQNASWTRVVPGDSAASLLFLKVSSDSPPVGVRMPFGGPPLSSADIALIRDWIEQGANNN